MKKITYTCDKCKEEFDEGLKNGNYVANVAGITKEHSLTLNHWKMPGKDLCKKCLREEVKFYLSL